ncbi:MULTISPECIES: UvrD-helicase domain-containing protein [Acinetobacter]|uniref:UvrD-helicase domain-containing protein n=1 Tax=Acinetobacter TaxID=469 RepID=UPI0001B8E4CC|nr:UvrD-helicase domain-containing protein [Acinetobacter sp. RUH 2624]EEX01151.1 hypothetical protein HMPREF0014_00506 [Acinetobacter sp. RUH 2624]
MKPTEEQEKSIELAISGQTFKMTAYAGAGKTSTLNFIGSNLAHRKGLYLAFNRPIAEEAAKKFSSNIDCKTFHSMAFRQTPKFITKKLNFTRLLPRTMAVMFDLRDYKIPLEIDNQRSETCDPSDQGLILTKALDFFCRSTSNEITHDMLMRAMPKWADKQYCHELATGLVDKANSLWKMSIDDSSKIRITHDIYLKYWALKDPEINAKFILFDEAQDADPIMLDILRKQAAQVIYVGDKHQQIYAFRGAVNAMQSLEIPETLLTKSFRFGAPIANVANHILFKLLGERVPLIGNERVKSYISEIPAPYAHLARTNAGALSAALDLALNGYKPQIKLDTKTLLEQLDDAAKLQNNQKVEKKSDFFGFLSWVEVCTYVEQFPNSDLTPVVTLIENHGTAYLINVITQLNQTKDYDCVVSTAHKSKGLEFSKVKIGDDFFWNEKKKGALMNDAEARLFYVACTRAINVLDISMMDKFFSRLKDISLY